MEALNQFYVSGVHEKPTLLRAVNSIGGDIGIAVLHPGSENRQYALHLFDRLVKHIEILDGGDIILAKNRDNDEYTVCSEEHIVVYNSNEMDEIYGWKDRNV